LALYRRLERKALVGKSPRVVAAAVIYAATCTPARAAAEALGVSTISVKEAVRRLRLAVKMCVRRGVGLRPVEVHAQWRGTESGWLAKPPFFLCF